MTPSPPWCMTFGSNLRTTAGVLVSMANAFSVIATPRRVIPERAAEMTGRHPWRTFTGPGEKLGRSEKQIISLREYW